MKALFDYLGLLLAVILLTALTLALTILPVRADGRAVSCVPYPSAVEQLADKWSEGLRGLGIASGGYVVSLFHDDAGDTWTLLSVLPNGTACVLASGTGWEAVQPPPAGTEG